MEPAEADAPPAPVYPVQASFTGVWTADPHTDTSNFHIVMDIVQDSTGTVTGTVRSTKSLDGSTSAWSVSGTAFGDSVVLAPTAWITRPNSGRYLDTITLVRQGSSMTATFVDERATNGEAWDSATVS